MTQSGTSTDLLQSLARLVSRVAADRDKAAFADLFDHYAPMIRAYSLAREPGADLVADELAQEVMTRIWLKASSYNPTLANLNTWVFTLARNCRIDYLRRNSRHRSDIDPTDVFNNMADEGPGPFQLAHQSRAAESVKNGLAQLPREQAEILTKVYLEGKSHQQASIELALPLGTVKSRVRLALKKLQVLITR
ncbi:MAG: RNA polymerase sigma factor (sigma-70 family) [Planctomycetota bacterium]|jgi:RNA polymerase sigma factor (sigma-70 family)